MYLGVLFFSICAMLFNNWAEFAIITQRLPVFYKQVNTHSRTDQHVIAAHKLGAASNPATVVVVTAWMQPAWNAAESIIWRQ